MPNVKISELPAGTAALTDIVPVMNSAGTTTSRITVSAMLDLLVDAAPGALNTLNELAAAINDDASFHTTITTALAGKASTSSPASIITSGTFPASRIDTGTTASTVCIGNDSRLSDARTPVAHAAYLVTSGTFDIARIPTGTSSSTVCIGNDSRLSDARTPTDHDAAKVTSGTFDIARIPTITQAKLPTTAVVSDTSTEANSAEIDNVVSISQTNYNSLVSAGTTNATTLYVIT